MSEYEGIRLGTITETQYVPYGKWTIGFVRVGKEGFQTEEDARLECEHSGVVVRETVTTTREILEAE